MGVECYRCGEAMTPQGGCGCKDGICLVCGDCREVLPTLETGAAQIVIADPPYTFGLASTMQEWSKAGGWGDLMNNALFYATWLAECRRLFTNSGGVAWVFNSWRSFPVLAKAAYEMRWAVSSLLVWDKQWIGPGGHVGLRPSYELVALFAQGERTLKDRGIPDIRRQLWSSQKPNGHPAEKPVELARWLIDISGAGTVLDPFAGSGTTGRACKDLGRRCIMVEIEEKYCRIAANRLRQEVLF
jgi:DNA modification methylase